MKQFIALAAAALLAVAFASPNTVAQAEKPKAGAEAAKSSFKSIETAQFEKMRKEKDAVVLDVRSKQEFDAGHIPGAVNIDVNSPDFEKKVAELDKSKTYLIHCASGRRSVTACQKLDQKDFPKLFNLLGGIQGWEKAGNKPEKTQK